MRGVDRIENAILTAQLALGFARWWRPLLKACARPHAQQWVILQRILRTNSASHFGSEHGFASLRSVAEFQRRVPWQSYESLRAYIDEQMQTGRPALTVERPVMYARTSGTTGAPKLLPVTPAVLNRYRRQQRMLAAMQVRVAPRAYAGKSLNIVGAAVEGRTASGLPYGSMSGFVRNTTPSRLQRRDVVPNAVFDIEDYDRRYQLILILALAERQITCLGSANPSTFLRLQSMLDSQAETVIRSIASGELPPEMDLPLAVRSVVMARLRKDPARAQELTSLAQRGALQLAHVWPDLQLLTTWTGGQCRVAMERLRPLLPAAMKVLDLGYIASELRGTLPIAADKTSALPLIGDHFFEFVERESWEAGRVEFVTVEQLSDGREYYLFVTTDTLYRYAMDDIVRVQGFVARTPLLEFVQKGRGCTSLVGEKLYESQVIPAMQGVLKQFGLDCAFYQLVADEQAVCYRLYLEVWESTQSMLDAIAMALDQRLAQLNVEYAAKRDSGRLHRLQVRRLRRGTGEAYVRHCVQAGQRENQFKQAVLQYARDLRFPFVDHVED